MNALKLLFNPIFLLAVGLHIGLMRIPVSGGASGDLVPAPNPEGESISVTRIPPEATQPVKPGIGQAANATRPATKPATTATQVVTAAQVAAVKKPTTTAANQQPSSSSRSQGSQPSSNGRSSSSSSSSSRSNNSSNQTARNNSSPGLPNLPSDPNSVPNDVPVTVSPDVPAISTPPTLTALKDGATSQEVPQPLMDFLAQLQYSLRETRDLATAEAQSAWLAQLDADRPNLNVSAPQKLDKALEINYPLTTEDNAPRQINGCLSPLPKQGLIGVVVDENRQITGEPELLRSSGYPFLNDIALEKVEDYADFPDEATQQIYTVPVEVNYNEDTCVSLTKLGVAPVSPSESP